MWLTRAGGRGLGNEVREFAGALTQLSEVNWRGQAGLGWDHMMSHDCQVTHSQREVSGSNGRALSDSAPENAGCKEIM